MKFIEVNKKLSKRKNWTDELIYVHRTRLIFGFLLGLIIGSLSTILMFLLLAGVNNGN